MKATTMKEAWSLANEIFPTDYMKDDARSERAGYDIYSSTLEGCRAWISDLGNHLEINLENGKSINIWIEAETHTDPEKTPTERIERTDTEIHLEAITTTTTASETTTKAERAHLTLSSETTLKDVAMFEIAARLLIKHARSAKRNGASVVVTLTKAKYRFTSCDDLKQEFFEMWTGDGDHITPDGVHLDPDTRYNNDPAHDMWITGDRGEILHEITI